MAKKPAPKPRYYAQIDPNTGNVVGYARGTNIDLHNSEQWADVTDIVGSKQLTNKIGQVIFRNGVFKKKPKLRLKLSNRRVEVGTDVKVTLELIEGDPSLLPSDLRIRIGREQYTMKLNDELTIKTNDARKINIRVNDPLVRLDDRVKSVRVVPVGTPAPTRPNKPGVEVGKIKGN